MRLLIAVFALSITASAITLKDFEARPGPQQGTAIADFIEKMTNDIGQSNPQMKKDIRVWFTTKMPGKPVSEGMERLYVELAAIEYRAGQGRVDLAKINLESVIVWVVKQKFK